MSSSDVVVITGAGKSIGLALALDLSSKHGYTVFAGVRSESDAEAMREQDRCAETGRGKLTPLMMDVTKPEQLQEAARIVAEEAGDCGVKAVINSPGYLPRGFVEFADVDEWTKAYDIQLNGNIRMLQAFGPLLRKHGDARFIMMSSPMAILTIPTMGSNVLNRGATEALAKLLRLEMHGQNIQISVVWPLGIRGGQVLQGEANEIEVKKQIETNPDWKPYTNAYKSFRNFYDLMSWKSGEVLPPAVVPTIVEALTAKKAKFRYICGSPPPKILLWAPNKMYIKMFLKRFWPKK